ncbi:MAG: hypothetical protein IKK71_05065 [Clostridia bacterium]|nr:hypothetical protein [Clostridia bacterium]
MRKFIALLLAPSLLFALAACGTNNTVSETDIPSSSQVSSTNSEDASSNSTDSSEISSDTTSTDDSSDVNSGSSKPSSSKPSSSKPSSSKPSSSKPSSSNPSSSKPSSSNPSSSNPSSSNPSSSNPSSSNPSSSGSGTTSSGSSADTPVTPPVEEPDKSGMTTIPMSASLEALTKLTTYDLLPTIKSAATIMKTAELESISNAKYVEDKELTTEAITSLRKVTDDRIAKIRNTPNLTIPSKAKVYYVSNSGNDSNDGLTPKTAWASLSKASSVKGSSGTETYVLFERGGLWRGQLVTSSYVTYSAYGEGDKPKLYASPFNAGGSENASKWVKNANNIWTFTSSQLKNDVGSLIFDDSLYATKRFTRYAIKSDLNFYHDYTNGIIYLYSTTNPATRFESIEFNAGNHIILAKSYVTIDNLCIKFGGKHGVSSGNSNGLTVKNCEFGWIGGSLQHPGTNNTRYGNAVEIWGYCGDYTVIDNYIHQIYDAGITQQISLTDNTLRKQERVLYSGNVIENCNYSIEYWITSTDANPSYIDTFLIEDNLMWYAGYGLCQTRTDRTNACHIQGWRFYERNRAKNYVVRNNVMIDSLNQIINIYSTEVNADGSDSMPTFNNNIMLNKEFGEFGVLRQGTHGDKSWPKAVLLTKSLFDEVDDVFNGDVVGIIDTKLYKGNQLVIE